MTYLIPKLPLKFDLETKTILKKLINAKSALMKLDGVSNIIPNKEILINTLSLQSITVIEKIKDLMQSHKNKMRKELPKIYSQDLLNATFNYPYTTTSILERELKKSRGTINKYLDELCNIDLATKIKKGRENYYINTDLVNLLSNVNT